MPRSRRPAPRLLAVAHATMSDGAHSRLLLPREDDRLHEYPRAPCLLEKHKVQQAIASATSAAILADRMVLLLIGKKLDPGYKIPRVQMGRRKACLPLISLRHIISPRPSPAVLKVCRRSQRTICCHWPILSKGDSAESWPQLSRRLGRRSSVAELSEKGIMKGSPGSVSSALQRKQAELERKMTATALENSLKKRASIESLPRRTLSRARPAAWWRFAAEQAGGA